jgi:hypothetical protein
MPRRADLKIGVPLRIRTRHRSATGHRRSPGAVAAAFLGACRVCGFGLLREFDRGGRGLD